jgi:hypothetical protein
MKNSTTPWQKLEHSWDSTSIADSDGNIICSLSIDDEATEDNQQELEEQMDANANLIVAVPDLLEALMLITSGANTDARSFVIAHNAIAKATGATNI